MFATDERQMFQDSPHLHHWLSKSVAPTVRGLLDVIKHCSRITGSIEASVNPAERKAREKTLNVGREILGAN